MAFDKTYWLNKQRVLQGRYQKKTEDVLASITQSLNIYFEDKKEINNSIGEIDVMIAEQENQTKIKEKEEQEKLKNQAGEKTPAPVVEKQEVTPTAQEIKKTNKQKNGK